jgi:hypothetical protein
MSITDEFDPGSLAAELTTELADSRPGVDITNEAEALEALAKVMAMTGGPGLYVRSGALVWLKVDEESHPVVQQLGADNLRAHIADQFRTYRMVKVGSGDAAKWAERRSVPAKVTCSTLLGRKDWDLPVLRGIVTSPVLRPDGRLLQTAGYDDDTGLYLVPRLPLEAVPDAPSDEQVESARELLLGEVLCDFPFVADSDRAQYVALLFSPIIRPMVPVPTPLGVITATAPGSGKGYLTEVLAHLYGFSMLSWSENDAELRKAITTQLVDRGDPVISFDNMPNGSVVKSPILAGLLTAREWTDRLLGANSSVSVPNDRLWIMTGNALRTGGDIARRALWVRLDPDCPRPDQRTQFKIGDLMEWLESGDNGGRLLHALLVLATKWAAEGAPRKRMAWGGYGPWASAMAGLLELVGIPGFGADRQETNLRDSDDEEWEPLLEAWFNSYQGRPVSAADALLTTAISALVPRTTKGELPSAPQFGKWLKGRDGRYTGVFKVTSEKDPHTKATWWTVRRYEPEAAPESAEG